VEKMITKYATKRENLTGLSEADLLLAAQKGNLQAFNRVVLFYQDEIFALAMWILGDEDSAEEITQDTFLAAYRNLSRSRNGPFRLWLCRSVIKACYAELRRRKSHSRQPLESISGAAEPPLPGDDFSNSDALPGKAYEGREFELQVQQALDRLDADQRVALVLVDLQDFSYQEAAQILGLPVGTVKSRLARARLQLRYLLIPSSGIKQLV
jgi:RNA polymerase sigma-70 factor (ECF subfamily)